MKIVKVELPCRVHGLATKTHEYTIYINSNDPFSEKIKTLLHETAHIALEHFESDKPYWMCEKEAREYADIPQVFATLVNNFAYLTWERLSAVVSLDIVIKCMAIAIESKEEYHDRLEKTRSNYFNNVGDTRCHVYCGRVYRV